MIGNHTTKSQTFSKMNYLNLNYTKNQAVNQNLVDFGVLVLLWQNKNERYI